MKGSDDGLVIGEFDFVILALSPWFIQFLLTNLYYLISLYSFQQVSDFDHFSKMKTHVSCVYQCFSEPLYTELCKTKEDTSFHFQNIARVSSLSLYTSSFLEAPSCVIIGGIVGQKGNSGLGNYCQHDYSCTQKVETSYSGILIIFQVMADIIHFKWEQFRDHLCLN